jgi:hypothetical protein
MQVRLEQKNFTIEQLEEILQEYGQAALKGKLADAHFAPSAFRISKACLLIYTKQILPKLLSPLQQCMIVDPGWCQTDLGTSQAPHTVEYGAARVMYLIQGMDYGRTPKYHAQFFVKDRVYKEMLVEDIEAINSDSDFNNPAFLDHHADASDSSDEINHLRKHFEH